MPEEANISISNEKILILAHHLDFSVFNCQTSSKIRGVERSKVSWLRQIQEDHKVCALTLSEGQVLIRLAIS